MSITYSIGIPVKFPIVEETEFYADPNFFSVLSKNILIKWKYD